MNTQYTIFFNLLDLKLKPDLLECTCGFMTVMCKFVICTQQT